MIFLTMLVLAMVVSCNKITEIHGNTTNEMNALDVTTASMFLNTVDNEEEEHPTVNKRRYGWHEERRRFRHERWRENYGNRW
jgi:hypothetical protein